jgi:hypothetical protein
VDLKKIRVLPALVGAMKIKIIEVNKIVGSISY